MPAVVALVLGACTLLLSEVPGVKPAPLGVDRLLTVPIELPQMTDLRDYAVPLGLAFLLLTFSWHREDGVAGRAVGWRAWWFEGLALATILCACLSASMNGTWASSRGWLFGLTCGLGWAILLARTCTLQSARRVVVMGAAVAVVGAILSFAHRQILGEPFFQLPVGPITLTASLGALWSAMALVGLTSSILQRRAASMVDAQRRSETPTDRPSATILFVALVTAALSLALLLAANRRGAWLGLIVGVGIAAGLWAWTMFSSKKGRAIILGIALAGLAAVGGYVKGQAGSADAAESLSLRFRAIYWKLMAESVAKSPIWGVGPDQFVMKASSALARQRAEQPTLLHGTHDSDGHNEWLQAAFELGIPGGLLYLALPIGAIIAGGRCWIRARGVHRTVLLIGITGLMVIGIAETSSVNLRYPILQGWYWTLLGLTVALTRERIDTEKPITRTSPLALRCMSAGAALIILFVVVTDLRAAMYQAEGRALLNNDSAKAAESLERAVGRFGAARWLSTRIDLGTAQANVLRTSRVPAALRPPGDTSGETEATKHWGAKAVATWKEIVRAAPGYLDSGFRLAEAQYSAGDFEGATATIDSFLRDVDPYHTQANVLLINIGGRPPMDNLEAVCRGLRSGAMSRWLVGPATRSLGTNEGIGQWPPRVEQARNDLSQPSEANWKDPLAPEVLRVEALRFATLRRFSEAAEAQRLAAEAYRKLNASRSPVARPMPAVADAWYGAARLLFDADPTKYAAAFKMILEAEQSVRLGVAGDVDDLNTKSDLGSAILASRTDELMQLLRFSAMLHLIAQDDLRQVQLRIGWSQARPTRESIDAELGRLALELVKVYGERPPEQRPAEWARVVEIARRALPAKEPGSP